MKFLIIQENGRHEKNRHFRECFCLQRALIANRQECTVWGLGHSNWKDPIIFNNYDIIINLENYDETGWVPNLSDCKAYKAIWSIDAHCRGLTPYLKTYTEGKYNVILQATKDFVDANSVWFPNCFDNTLIQPRNIQKRTNVGFCGNVVNRDWILKILKDHCNLLTDIFIIGDDMVNAINSYKIHFNMNISNDINYRSFETIGCKIPLVTNFNPQYEELGFKDEVNCLIYKNPQEAIDKIKKGLTNESFLNTIAENGYELSKKHTYNKRASHLIKYLEKQI